MIILNLLLRYYKDMFARIWFFSPSIKLDPQYAPLRKYLEKMSDQDKEPLMFEDLDQQALGKILHEQRLISEECRKRKEPIPQVCVILDDLADRGDILQKRQGAASGGLLASHISYQRKALWRNVDSLQPSPQFSRDCHPQELPRHGGLEAPEL